MSLVTPLSNDIYATPIDNEPDLTGYEGGLLGLMTDMEATQQDCITRNGLGSIGMVTSEGAMYLQAQPDGFVTGKIGIIKGKLRAQ